MSELKVIDLGDIRECIEKEKPLCYEYYAKSEADNVIADLKQKMKQQDVLLGKALNTISESHKHVVSLARKCNHANYKRCLAMAKYCEERYNYLTCLENWQLTDKEYQQVIGEYWDRWHIRWLNISEKFYEAK